MKVLAIVELSRIKSLLKGMSLASIFLVVSSVIGIGLAVVTPPFQGWDESEHFLRAYQVSEFNIRSEQVIAPNASGLKGTVGLGYGGTLPRAVVDSVGDLRFNEDAKGKYLFSKLTLPAKNNTNYGDKISVRFDNTAIYSPVAYLPQAIGIGFAKVFTDSTVVMMYTARLAGLTMWVGMIYLAMRLISETRVQRVFFVLALNPVAIFLAVTISPDGVATAVVGLATAIVLAVRRKTIDNQNSLVYLLILLLTMLVLVKNVYAPVALLIFLVPKHLLSIYVKIATVVLMVSLSLLWNISVASITPFIPSYFALPYYVNAGEQVSFILHNPIKYLFIMVWNIFGTGSLLLNLDYVGIFLSNSLPDWVVITWLACLGYVVFTSRTAKELPVRLKDRIIEQRLYVLIYAVVSVLILTSLYVGWSVVGDKDISGVQGRYFIPLGYLLAACVSVAGFKRVRVGHRHDVYVFGTLVLGLIVTVGSIFVRYNVGV